MSLWNHDTLDTEPFSFFLIKYQNSRLKESPFFELSLIEAKIGNQQYDKRIIQMLVTVCDLWQVNCVTICWASSWVVYVVTLGATLINTIWHIFANTPPLLITPGSCQPIRGLCSLHWPMRRPGKSSCDNTGSYLQALYHQLLLSLQREYFSMKSKCS